MVVVHKTRDVQATKLNAEGKDVILMQVRAVTVNPSTVEG